MPRYSIIRPDRVEYGFWLVFTEDGDVRMTRGEPQLARGERSMGCTTTLPRSLFKTPTLKATIGIAEGAAQSEFKIDIEAATEALRQAVGCDIHLQVLGGDDHGS